MGSHHRPKQKMGAMRPPGFPSFVYRQDGYELSYKVGDIIPIFPSKVKRAEVYCTLASGVLE